MPICPGCERSVPYDRLDLHQRYCERIRGGELDRTRAVERLDQRLGALELRLERLLTQVEQARRTVGRANSRE